jgi:hypothetical protein
VLVTLSFIDTLVGWVLSYDLVNLEGVLAVPIVRWVLSYDSVNLEGALAVPTV